MMAIVTTLMATRLFERVYGSKALRDGTDPFPIKTIHLQ